MKKFIFRLEKIRSFSLEKEKQARMALASSLGEKEKLLEEQKGLEKEKEKLFSNALQKYQMNASMYLLLLDQRGQKISQKLSEQEDEIEQARTLFKAALQKREVFDQLREKRRSEYKKEVQKNCGAEDDMLKNLGMLVIYLVVLLVFSIGTLFILDRFDIVRTYPLYQAFFSRIGISSLANAPASQENFLSQALLEKREEQVFLLEKEMQNQLFLLQERQKELDLREQELDFKQKEYEKREKSFLSMQENLNDRQQILEQNANYLTQMNPQNAVNILLEMDDLSIVDLIKVIEIKQKQEQRVSIVPYWLSLMPQKRASEIQKKLIQSSSFKKESQLYEDSQS